MRKNRQNHKKVYNVVVILVMTLIGLIFILPYVWMLLNSFKPLTEIAKGKTFWPKQWTMKNYHTVMTQAPIWKWLRNSVITSVSGTVIMLVTSSLAGFVFAKYSFKGKEFIFMIILATMMVPSQTTMIPSFLLVQGLGMYDSLLALIIPRMVGGFGIFLCRQFIMDIPDELVEAAHIDGAHHALPASARDIFQRFHIPLDLLHVFLDRLLLSREDLHRRRQLMQRLVVRLQIADPVAVAFRPLLQFHKLLAPAFHLSAPLFCFSFTARTDHPPLRDRLSAAYAGIRHACLLTHLRFHTRCRCRWLYAWSRSGAVRRRK